MKQPNRATAVMAHGANPGLVEHLLKEAMMNMVHDAKLNIEEPTTIEGWAKLSQTLGIRVVHVAERDTQISTIKKQSNEYVNTWSIDGMVDESILVGEVGWGTHETYCNINEHEEGTKTAILLK